MLRQILVAAGMAVLSPITPSPAQSGAGAPALLATPYMAPSGWRVRGLDGTLRPLSEWRGRVVVLNMWASWCAPCMGEMDSFRLLRDSLRAGGLDADAVALVLLTPESVDRVARFARRRLADLPVFAEHDPLPPEFGVRAVPTTWILDRDGRVVLAHRGAADWSAPPVRALLRQLAGAPARADGGRNP
ncbi:MAG: peroxiredoxin family protein [Gemmatimonadaceae bacterium]